MALDAAQEQKVRQWLQAKFPVGLRCPYCQTMKWTLGQVISAPELTSGAVNIGGPSLPMVQVVCNNCAHVALFAAVPVGVAS